jgi:acyl-CoA thioester hydrolase
VTDQRESFRHTLRIRYLECDPQGVVGHHQYLALFDVAMTEMWREVLGSYGEMVAEGVDLVVAESRLRYRSPARFDEELDIAVAVRHLGTTSIAMSFEASVEGRPVVDGENRYVCIRAGGLEPVPIPGRIRDGLSRRLVPEAGSDRAR